MDALYRYSCNIFRAPSFYKAIFDPPEDEINFESFIKYSQTVFKLLKFDLQPLSENTSLNTKIKYHARFLVIKFCVLSSSIAFFQTLMYMFFIADNFDKLGRAIIDWLSIVLICSKGYTTVLRQDKIWKITVELKAVFDQRVKANRNHKVKKYLDLYHRVIKVPLTISLVLFLVMIVSLVLQTISGKMRFFLYFWYPFDAFKVTTFPFAILWQVWHSLEATAVVQGTNTLFYAFLTVISMEFYLLKSEMMSLKFVSNEESKKHFKILIERHNKLHDITDRVQEVYGAIFLYTFITSALVLCLQAFQIATGYTGGEAAFQLHFYHIFLTALFASNTWLLCYFGQKLIDSSVSVAEGAYGYNWMDLDDIDLKKQIALIILRSQRPHKLTAMKFADISFDAFTNVIYFLDIISIWSN